MEVFFYGLFMDIDLLERNGLKPSNPRKGYLDNYTLKIGNRASLIPWENDKAHGILITVDSEATRALYTEPSVADYIPEDVVVITETDEQVEAVCYNLPLNLLTGTNPSYARALFELGSKLDLPKDYLMKIKGMM